MSQETSICQNKMTYTRRRKKGKRAVQRNLSASNRPAQVAENQQALGARAETREKRAAEAPATTPGRRKEEREREEGSSK